MDWIHHFQLFLFDFDGLLVNTEALHYQAYVDTLLQRGYRWNLTFDHFIQSAHQSSQAWQELVYQTHPDLKVSWDLLYQEKKRKYVDLLSSFPLKLMPGVEPLLQALARSKIRRCVVTHSSLDHVEKIRSRIPALQTLPHWMTREEYVAPKPNPECYAKAIAFYGKKEDRIIGFEDSLRGLRALLKTQALPVMICQKDHPLLETALREGGIQFESLEKITESSLFKKRSDHREKGG